MKLMQKSKSLSIAFFNKNISLYFRKVTRRRLLKKGKIGGQNYLYLQVAL